MDRLHRIMLTVVAALLLVPMAVSAQEKEKEEKQEYYRPLFTALELQLGGAHWIETPLSNLSYKGTNLSVGVEMMRAYQGKDGNSKWVQQHQLRYNYGSGHIAISGAGGSNYHMGDYTFALMHHSTVAPKLRLYYGFDLGASAGMIDNAHGGNNPFTAKLDASLGFTGMAVYDFNLGKLPITARYQMSLPVVGAFSQLHWGQLPSGFLNGIHFGTWKNRFDMTNRVHLDLHIGTWALRLGYHNDIVTNYATDNRYQLITHNFVVGFAGDLMRWSKKNDNKIIKPALYQY